MLHQTQTSAALTTKEPTGVYEGSHELPAALHADPRQILAWAFECFGPQLVLASSLGPQSLVVLDLATRLGWTPRVVFLDTGLHFPETYDFLEEVEEHFEVPIERLRPAHGVERELGPQPWKETPDRCCELRKVEPLRRALYGSDAWITGLRRSQSAERSGVHPLEWDSQYGLYKLSPLAGWSRTQLETYRRQRNLPQHPLRGQGYLSIGCFPCTRPSSGDDERSGRWSGQAKRECGLHLGTLKARVSAQGSATEAKGVRA